MLNMLVVCGICTVVQIHNALCQIWALGVDLASINTSGRLTTFAGADS